MLALAKSNLRDYYMMRLLRYSLRIGEVVGNGKLHGIRGADLRPDGIWIKGKGGGEHFVHIKQPFMTELSSLFTSRGNDRIFPISERRAEQIVKDYARKASVVDWEYVSPHRFRAYYATDLRDRGVDPFTIRDGMRHKNIQTTNLYVGPTSQKRMAEIAESLD